MISYQIIQQPDRTGEFRLGELYSGSIKVTTPFCACLTSKGVVPHLSPDLVLQHVNTQVFYLAAEDFVEDGVESSSLISYPKPSASRLKDFTGLPRDRLTIVGPRRISPLLGPSSNSDRTVNISTSVGFRPLTVDEFKVFVKQTQPDLFVGISDVGYSKFPGRKRREKMCLRTKAWMGSILKSDVGEPEVIEGTSSPGIFAPILPLYMEEQRHYINILLTEARHSLSGLAIYDPSSVGQLPADLKSLCRLSLVDAKTPHELLAQVALGIDILTAPFLQDATDAGVCLSFSFPAPLLAAQTPKQPLGIDMWDQEHITSMEALKEGCPCYTCQRHSRAYVQHLLSAKEMLAWTLLQIHNLQILDQFFSDIRSSIALGTYERDRANFEQCYEATLPAKIREAARTRGYQFKSEDLDALDPHPPVSTDNHKQADS